MVSLKRYRPTDDDESKISLPTSKFKVKPKDLIAAALLRGKTIPLLPESLIDKIRGYQRVLDHDSEKYKCATLLANNGCMDYIKNVITKSKLAYRYEDMPCIWSCILFSLPDTITFITENDDAEEGVEIEEEGTYPFSAIIRIGSPVEKYIHIERTEKWLYLLKNNSKDPGTPIKRSDVIDIIMNYGNTHIITLSIFRPESTYQIFKFYNDYDGSKYNMWDRIWDLFEPGADVYYFITHPSK